ncbi:MAG: hypothetical protein O3C21_06760 [Verrucomicrobia bacterium]|nr:hypothetical protein [Verrucomicrobiota bacterium]
MRLSYTETKNKGTSLEEAIRTLHASNKLLLLNGAGCNLKEEEKLNQQLVQALSRVSGKNLAELTQEIDASKFHHPRIRELGSFLLEASLELPPFANLNNHLKSHQLEIRSAECEKFSLHQKNGALQIWGMGLFLHVVPVDFSLPPAEKTLDARLSLSLPSLKKEGDRWIGTFFLSHRTDKPLRIYGRWSEPDQSYVVNHRDLAWTMGEHFETDLAGEIPKDSPSFKINPATSYNVRVPLGPTTAPRAAIRIFSPSGTIQSSEFFLNEAPKQ